MLGSGDIVTGLVIEDLTVRYQANGADVTAVDRVSLRVPPRMTVGLVGESGSGKSSLAKAIVGLTPHAGGQITLQDRQLGGRSVRARRRLGREIQMIFQDPDTALDPRMSVGRTLAEALTAFQRLDRRAQHRRTLELLELVGLSAGHVDRLPRELSGGQRQRVAIARALAVEPTVIVADEITSALDVSVQAAILNTMRDLQRQTGISMLFVGHNLAAVRYVSDEIAVMRAGQIVETGPAEELLRDPSHPYTRSLLAAVPDLDSPSTGEQLLPRPANEDQEAPRCL